MKSNLHLRIYILPFAHYQRKMRSVTIATQMHGVHHSQLAGLRILLIHAMQQLARAHCRLRGLERHGRCHHLHGSGHRDARRLPWPLAAELVGHLKWVVALRARDERALDKVDARVLCARKVGVVPVAWRLAVVHLRPLHQRLLDGRLIREVVGEDRHAWPVHVGVGVGELGELRGARRSTMLHRRRCIVAVPDNQRRHRRVDTNQVGHLVESPAAQVAGGACRVRRLGIHERGDRRRCCKRRRRETCKRQLLWRVLHREEAAVNVIAVHEAVTIVVNRVEAVVLELCSRRALWHDDPALARVGVGEVAKSSDVHDVNCGRRGRKWSVEVDRVAEDPRLEEELGLVNKLLLARKPGQHRVDVPGNVVPVGAVVRAVLDHRRQVNILLVVARDEFLRLAHVQRVVGRLEHPRGSPREVVQHARRVVQLHRLVVLHQDVLTHVVSALRV
mmetsp:Transcript_28381/g.83996  ORF Transcript_28381/g.83996 Transcript_28381/m.83996 type:complete len:447 (-) Transcript_28381:2656-3996(-)